MGFKVITLNAEPITLAEALLHVRGHVEVDSPPGYEDTLIEGYITAARQHIEQFTNSSIASQVLELALDAFPCGAIWLPAGPARSVVSVKYTDADNVEQTIDPVNYVLDTYSPEPWVMPVNGYTWPTAMTGANTVRVRYQAGYTLPGDSPNDLPLPGTLRSAMLLTLGHLYENREDVVVGGGAPEQIPQGAMTLAHWHRRNMGV